MRSSGNTLIAADRDRYTSARALGEREARDPSGVTAARYLPRRDSIEVVFASGGTMAIPRCAIAEFADAPTDALKGLTVSVAGDAVACPALDVDVAVPGLVETVFGPRLLSSAFARRGGRRTPKAKAAAVRANGAKGGRPRNRPRR